MKILLPAGEYEVSDVWLGKDGVLTAGIHVAVKLDVAMHRGDRVDPVATPQEPPKSAPVIAQEPPKSAPVITADAVRLMCQKVSATAGSEKVKAILAGARIGAMTQDQLDLTYKALCVLELESGAPIEAPVPAEQELKL